LPARTPVLLLTAAVLSSGCVAAPPPAAVTPSTTRRVLSSESAKQRSAEITVRVRNRACDFLATGSGFAVGRNLLVTNRHVVEEAEQLQLDTWDGTSIAVEVHSVAYLNDLALIQTIQNLPRVAELAPGDPRDGASVSVVGFPLGGPMTTTAGKVVDTVTGTELGEESRVVRITAKVRHGNSGGPLLDAEGRVAGVVYAIERGSGYGLAIPVSVLRSFLAAGSPDETPEPCS
jgi:S1-C subfamily serine protease